MIKKLIYRWQTAQQRRRWRRKYHKSINGKHNGFIGFDGHEWIVVDIHFVGCEIEIEDNRLLFKSTITTDEE